MKEIIFPIIAILLYFTFPNYLSTYLIILILISGIYGIIVNASKFKKGLFYRSFTTLSSSLIVVFIGLILKYLLNLQIGRVIITSGYIIASIPTVMFAKIFLKRFKIALIASLLLAIVAFITASNYISIDASIQLSAYFFSIPILFLISYLFAKGKFGKVMVSLLFYSLTALVGDLALIFSLTNFGFFLFITSYSFLIASFNQIKKMM